MSTTEHEREASVHANQADSHGAQFNPDAEAQRSRCSTRARGDDPAGPCWTSVDNPTAEHARAAAEHRRHAADHRAASAALRDAEGRACVGVSPEDRDQSPFDHGDDVASVEPLYEETGGSKVTSRRTTGAVVTFRAVPGMTAEWLQRSVDCHLARNAALGHAMPEMPDCPLVPKGVEARVTSTGNGFAVAITSKDGETAHDIVARAQRLRGAASPAAGR